MNLGRNFARMVETCLSSLRTDRTTDHTTSEPKQLSARHSLLRAARSAGIGRDVASDRAIGAAGGVRRIKEPLLFDRFLKRGRDPSRFDDRHEIVRVDLLDSI